MIEHVILSLEKALDLLATVQFTRWRFRFVLLFHRTSVACHICMIVIWMSEKKIMHELQSYIQIHAASLYFLWYFSRSLNAHSSSQPYLYMSFGQYLENDQCLWIFDLQRLCSWNFHMCNSYKFKGRTSKVIEGPVYGRWNCDIV